jgi:O-antigen/teichoic acid export membrane protein
MPSSASADRRGPIAAIKRQLAEPLARTSAGLAASTLLSAVLGVGFWALAARLLSAKQVGRDSALVAALLALAGIGQLNLNNVFPRFLPQAGIRRGRLVSAGYGASAACSFLLGLLFVVVAPDVSTSFAFIHREPLFYVLFPTAVAAWAIFSLQDAVLIALGRAAWLPIENGLFSLARIICIPLTVGLLISHAVFIAYVVPMFGAIAIMNWLIARRELPAAASSSDQSRGLEWRALFPFLVKDFAGTVTAQLMMSAVPLLVLALLGPTQNAYFYVPFTLVTTMDLLFLSVAASLTTEAARTPARAAELARRAIRWLVRIELPAVACVVLAAPLILLPYGSAYVHHGSELLRLMAVGSCFRSVVFVYGAVARLQGRAGRLLVVQLALAVFVVGAVAFLGVRLGLAGIGLGWLVGWALGAATVAIPLRRFTRNPTVWQAHRPGERDATGAIPGLAPQEVHARV